MRYLPDVLFLLGAALSIGGVWMAWPPLALILGGVAFMAFGIVGAPVTRKAGD